ncbi:hypothetical protein OROGR_020988 [Orobanche gracilis]
MKRSRMEILSDDGMDRLSDLPDYLVLYIMQFMEVKHAVRTCLLSKRWEHLWKRLATLALDSRSSSFLSSTLGSFNKFVSRILSCRDRSIPLHSLYYRRTGHTSITLLNRTIKYAVSHHVHNLNLCAQFELARTLELPSCLFSCPSLTSLRLSFYYLNLTRDKAMFPKSLHLPLLKSLHIGGFTFTTSDNGCVDPFSTLKKLNTLVIKCCYLNDDAKVKFLCITNSELSSLTLSNLDLDYTEDYAVVLCTPKLSSLTAQGRSINQLSSSCNLPFLRQGHFDVNIHGDLPKKGLVLISWMQMLTNVTMMTLRWSTINLLIATRPQLPCFVRLKSLKVKMDTSAKLSDDLASSIVEDLLQNSPLARVDIIRALSP